MSNAKFLFLMTILLFSSRLTVDAQVPGDELLTDPGLNSNSQPLLSFLSSNLNRWMQENASLVTGTQTDGVAPAGGDGMLRIIRASLSESQVRQRIDISSLAGDIDAGNVIIEGIGQLNSSTGGITAGIIVSALDDSQANLTYMSDTSVLDADTGTWVHSTVQFCLPPGTRYLEFQFTAINNTLPNGESVYGDEASLTIYDIKPVELLQFSID